MAKQIGMTFADFCAMLDLHPRAVHPPTPAGRRFRRPSLSHLVRVQAVREPPRVGATGHERRDRGQSAIAPPPQTATTSGSNGRLDVTKASVRMLAAPRVSTTRTAPAARGPSTATPLQPDATRCRSIAAALAGRWHRSARSIRGSLGRDRGAARPGRRVEVRSGSCTNRGPQPAGEDPCARCTASWTGDVSFRYWRVPELGEHDGIHVRGGPRDA